MTVPVLPLTVTLISVPSGMSAPQELNATVAVPSASIAGEQFMVMLAEPSLISPEMPE